MGRSPCRIDSRKAAVDDVMQIGDVKINVKDMKKGPMVFGDSIDSSFQMVFGESIDSLFQKFVMTNDHEACSINSKDKYSQPW